MFVIFLIDFSTKWHRSKGTFKNPANIANRCKQHMPLNQLLVLRIIFAWHHLQPTARVPAFLRLDSAGPRDMSWGQSVLHSQSTWHCNTRGVELCSRLWQDFYIFPYLVFGHHRTNGVFTFGWVAGSFTVDWLVRKLSWIWMSERISKWQSAILELGHGWASCNVCQGVFQR